MVGCPVRKNKKPCSWYCVVWNSGSQHFIVHLRIGVSHHALEHTKSRWIICDLLICHWARPASKDEKIEVKQFLKHIENSIC